MPRNSWAFVSLTFASLRPCRSLVNEKWTEDWILIWIAFFTWHWNIFWRMSLIALPYSQHNEIGLWEDVFHIKWFTRWLSISICVWSFMKRVWYLHFTRKKYGYEYNILFQDKKKLHMVVMRCFYHVNFMIINNHLFLQHFFDIVYSSLEISS